RAPHEPRPPPRANENPPPRRHRVQTTPQQQSIGSSFFHLFSSRTMQFGDQSGNVCEHTVEGRSSRKIITHKSCRQQEQASLLRFYNAWNSGVSTPREG